MIASTSTATDRSATAEEPEAGPVQARRAGVRIVLLATIASGLALLPAAAAQATLVTVELAGAGTGKVTGSTSANPTAIDCSNTGGGTPGPDCSEDVGFFQTVTVTATADSGSVFTGWSANASSGNCNSGTQNPCSFGVIATPVTVTATFEVIPDPLEVTIDDLSPGDLTDTTATFHGTVNPNGNPLTACRFEYVLASDPDGFNSSAVESVPCDPGASEIGDGTDPVPVQATAVGLEPNRTYRVRLVASKDNADDGIAEATPFTTKPGPPGVTDAQATFLTDSGATLRGRINPRNSQTTYRFEYTDDANFQVNQWANAIHVPDPDGDAGSGGTGTRVSEQITGLRPNTTYHFRLVANNGTGGDQATEDRTFTTLAGPPPPFGPPRAYEVASQLPSGGVSLPPGRMGMSVAGVDGSAIFYTSLLPLPGHELPTYDYIARRGEQGWTTVPGSFYPPERAPSSNLNDTSTAPPPDLSEPYVQTRLSFDPDDQNHDEHYTTGDDIYRVESDGELTWISRDPRIPAGTAQTDDARVVHAGTPRMSAVSADGEVLVFKSRRQLLDDDTTPSNEFRLYEWAHGELRFIGLRPDGSVPAGGSELGGAESGANAAWSPSAVSRDGSRVVFSAEREDGGGTTLYVHRDGQPTVEAVEETGIDPLPPPHPMGVEYWGADADLSRVFFTSASRLTPDSGGSNDTRPGRDDSDLYAYDVESDAMRNLTPRLDGGSDPSVDPAPEDRAHVVGVPAISDDGRRVYFVAHGVLDAEPSPLGESPTQGRTAGTGHSNLYLAELGDDIDDPVRVQFIARVGHDGSGDDLGLWNDRSNRVWRFNTADTSPDGSVFAFGTVENVTGEPTGGERQYYVFDAEANSLACVSCPADGSPPAGPANKFVAGDSKVTETWQSETGYRHWVTDDGTVFFFTPTALLPGDRNHVNDVYEYRDGELRLVTPGAANGAPSSFLGASTDGTTVFFATADALAPQDDEPGVLKVYAARLGGGIPAPPTPRPPCVGDDCQGENSAAPEATAPATSSLSGPGNPVRHANSCQRLERRVERARRQLRRAEGGADARRARRKLRRAVERFRRCERGARICVGLERDLRRAKRQLDRAGTQHAKRRAKRAKKRLRRCRRGAR